MLIYKFIKNALEEIRIETSTYQGKEYLSIRTWFDASRGQNTDWQPSQKGITLSVDLLQELLKGLKLAEKGLKKEDPQLSLPDQEESGGERKTKKERKDFAGSSGEIPF
ncbi:unnamed protein product [marine sediment metagenome]|uniref:Transcriptional coactivator p15 (PC4) C-terminal domain-containing protein n=1 Tax=marine sediment metagenome TaxID=412755 RepID=X1MPF9_9ZZZZ